MIKMVNGFSKISLETLFALSRIRSRSLKLKRRDTSQRYDATSLLKEFLTTGVVWVRQQFALRQWMASKIIWWKMELLRWLKERPSRLSGAASSGVAVPRECVLAWSYTASKFSLSLLAFCTNVSWGRPVSVSSYTVVIIYHWIELNWPYLI